MTAEIRQQIVELGASLFARRLTFGRTGNLSVRDILLIPTGASLGALDPEELKETARLHLLLQGHRTRPLTPEQAAGLRRTTPQGAAR